MKPQTCCSSCPPRIGDPKHSNPSGRYRHGCDPPDSQRSFPGLFFTNLRSPDLFGCHSTDFPQIRFTSVIFNCFFTGISGQKRGLTTALKSNHQLATVCLVFVCVLLNLGMLPLTALTGMAAEEPEASASANARLIPLMVHLEKALYFGDSDGQTVLVHPGVYLVEPLAQDEPRLVFWHEQGTVTLQATRTTHDQRLKTPEAYLIQENDHEDMHHVVVFLPDGNALEATGSINAIQTRGNFRVTKHYQLDAATGVVRFGDGQQGSRLPTSQPNISTQYREGSGSQGGTELSMMKLQSAISNRQMAVQVTTAFLNKLQGQFQFEEGTDRPGNDYARHMEDSPGSCRTRCAGDGNCQAFTFVKPNSGSTQGQCFLKRSEPQPVANPCCVSGTRSSSQDKIIRNIGR
ncbi:MAG: PAN domain-containing protein [Nitrospirales bacterium]